MSGNQLSCYIRTKVCQHYKVTKISEFHDEIQLIHSRQLLILSSENLFQTLYYEHQIIDHVHIDKRKPFMVIDERCCLSILMLKAESHLRRQSSLIANHPIHQQWRHLFRTFNEPAK
jgi:hypothetical protein